MDSVREDGDISFPVCSGEQASAAFFPAGCYHWPEITEIKTLFYESAYEKHYCFEPSA